VNIIHILIKSHSLMMVEKIQILIEMRIKRELVWYIKI
jgi:hypothetical protein